MSGPVVVWFRQDLRTHDNSALRRGSEFASQVLVPVVGVFIVPMDDWERNSVSPARRDLILRTLPILRNTLMSKYGIPLVVKVVDKSTKGYNADCTSLGSARLGASAAMLCDVAEQLKAPAVFFNVEQEHDEHVRDQQVTRLLETRKVRHYPCPEAQCIVSPGLVLNAAKQLPYKVFTPFKKAWIRHLQNNSLELYEEPRKNVAVPLEQDHLRSDQLPKIEQLSSELRENVERDWPAGEQEAVQRLERFVEGRAQAYKDTRDFPANDEGTSRLSAYLACGSLSSRLCLSKAQAKNGGKLESGSQGLEMWISELCWRDFYRHIMFHFGHVARGQPFQLKTNSVAWRGRPPSHGPYYRHDHSAKDDKDAYGEGGRAKRLKVDKEEAEADFEAWQRGLTGYPLVDASMRCLRATGWLHNRLRMIVAMFLTKDLLIWWPRGEEWFMRTLIDGDFASNNGGWQWSASTGTDSQPYFRIFNPVMQSERYDPDGAFIRRWLPELRALSTKDIHDPFHRLQPVEFAALCYPKPIIDHGVARQRCLQAFMKVFKKTTAT